MKKVLFVFMALCLVSSLAFAAEPTTTTATTEVTAPAAATTVTTTVSTPAAAESAVAVPAVTTEAAATTEPAVTTTVTTTVTAPEAVALRGVVVDNTCAVANKDNLAEFVKTHTKECALKPGCIESGYSIFADGKLHAFDKDSNAKVAEFLKQADSKTEVIITAKQVGDELSLASIKNQN